MWISLRCVRLFLIVDLLEVCEVRARETETVAVQLAKHEHGHKVVMSMLEVSQQ